MGTTKICVSGLTETQNAFIEMKVREVVKTLTHCNDEKTVKIWREEKEE